MVCFKFMMENNFLFKWVELVRVKSKTFKNIIFDGRFRENDNNTEYANIILFIMFT